MARETWTDHRLDDLNRRVDEGFKDMREEIRAVRLEMSTQSAAQHRTMVQIFAGLFGTFVIGFIGIVVTILTQV
ncbi:MAG TPA: hypothetical protein VFX44_01890 [Solirubrobacterales bacterium]|nr:hypothetical protein [Solirubrobacterales bacterium]